MHIGFAGKTYLGMRMGVSSGEYIIIKELLAEGESVGIEISESRLGGGRIFAPAHAFATEQRIIIVRNDFLGFKNSVKIIRYEHITEIKMERGMGYCRLHFSLIGEQVESAEDMKWISGLRYSDALSLIQFVNKRHFKPVVAAKENGREDTKIIAQARPPMR